MFGFPVNLQDSGVQKFTNDADSGFPKIQQREVFYSVKDGNWTDLNTWQTASGRVGLLPTQYDDVYIRNNIIISASGLSCNNLFISKNLIHNGASSQYVFYVFGNLKFTPNGILDFRTAVVQQLEVYLYGNDNIITDNNLIYNAAGANGIISYARNGNQDILPLTYRNIQIRGSGVKYLTSDLNIIGQLIAYGGVLEAYWYNLIVNGITIIQSAFSKSHYGNLLFIGELQVSQNAIFDLSQGNADVELRGGLNGRITPDIRTGTGTWSFTTNNQAIFGDNGNCTITFNGNVVIGSGVTLTVRNCVINLVNIINGVDSTSNLINGFTSQGTTLSFITQIAAENSMSIGTFNFTTYSTNIISFAGNYSATIPSRFTTFHNLTISGTGTKSLGVNTTLNGNLSVTSSGNFQLSTYDLVVTGTSTLTGTGVIYPLQKSGSGNVTFIGQIIGQNSVPTLDFSGGNPSVYVRGGILIVANPSRTQFNSGTGTWTFETNNQTIDSTFGGNTLFFDGQVLIGSGITLTIGAVRPNTIVLNNALGINGISGTSTLVNGPSGTIRLDVNCTLMSTGIFNIPLNSTSTLYYNFAGNYTLPYTSFANLQIWNSGIKTLSGNTTMQNLLMNDATNGPILECSIYDLTINGTTFLINKFTDQTYYILRKSGSGNVLFVGLITLSNNSARLIDFSGGNPSVELRGGMAYVNSLTTVIKSGSGTWSFTTNNQSLTQTLGGGTLQFDCSVLISGAITLSQINNSTSASTLIFTGTINGNNANSKFAMGSVSTGTNTLNYQSATQPMATGILDTSTNLNTWIYGLGNQDIKGSPTISPKQVYRNLTLNGTGVKTLQGYVSVLNTYTLTAPATLANNGFTLTNP